MYMINFKEINPYYDKITLIGMMGTGKSKFGRQIANILKYNFYDIDHMIEKKFKITIKQLFQKHGEVFFRKIEKKTIRDLILKINENKEKFDSVGFLNVGSGEEISIKSLAELIAKEIGFKGDIIWDEDKPDGTPRKLLNIDKIREVGWVPKIKLDEGIKKTIFDYKSEVKNGILRS